jgi:hypothetical protein
MAQVPGVYHLLLEGKNGKRRVAKLAVADARIANNNPASEIESLPQRRMRLALL